MTNPDRKKLVRILVLVAVVDLLIAGGILLWWFNRPHEPQQQDEDGLAASLINLSAAVDAYFSGAEAVPTGSDEEILRQATAHDSSLLAVFKPYRIRVQRQDSYAVLLLCTEDGRQAVLEDAGCSARLDRRAEKGAPCEFTLKVGAGCKVTRQ
jgi:hypothetical protein